MATDRQADMIGAGTRDGGLLEQLLGMSVSDSELIARCEVRIVQ